MRIHDLYKDQKGIFYYLSELDYLPYIHEAHFTINTLDLTFISLYGSRELSPTIKNVVKEDKIDSVALKNIARILYTIFHNKWLNLYEMYRQEFDLDTYNLSTTETIKDKGGRENTDRLETDGENLSSVSGYNSDDMFDPEDNYTGDTKNTAKTTDKRNTKGTDFNDRVRETTVSGNTSNRIEDRNLALESLRFNFIEQILFKDVSETVGLLIY